MLNASFEPRIQDPVASFFGNAVSGSVYNEYGFAALVDTARENTNRWCLKAALFPWWQRPRCAFRSDRNRKGFAHR